MKMKGFELLEFTLGWTARSGRFRTIEIAIMFGKAKQHFGSIIGRLHMLTLMPFEEEIFEWNKSFVTLKWRERERERERADQQKVEILIQNCYKTTESKVFNPKTTTTKKATKRTNFLNNSLAWIQEKISSQNSSRISNKIWNRIPFKTHKQLGATQWFIVSGTQFKTTIKKVNISLFQF